MIRKGSFFLLGGFLSIFLYGCISLPYDLQTKTKETQSVAFQSKFHVSDGRQIYSVQAVNPNSKNIILFIHGSPGNFAAYSDYLQDKDLQEKATLISVDRLGFGESGIDQFEINLQIHAKAIAEIIQTEKHKNIIVVGHSYGGPVAVRLAIDYPNQINGLILLAASVSPELETRRWYNEVASWWVTRLFLPQMWDNSNQEILPLKKELLEMAPHWQDIKVPVVAIHGKDDGPVPVENTLYIKEQLTNTDPEIILLKNQGHFIIWEQYDLVKRKIIEMLK